MQNCRTYIIIASLRNCLLRDFSVASEYGIFDENLEYLDVNGIVLRKDSKILYSYDVLQILRKFLKS